MKLFIFAAFLISTAAMAIPMPVFPRVTYNTRSVYVQIFNNNDEGINCSGNLNITTSTGRRTSAYYSRYLFKYGSTYDTYNLRSTDASETISYVSHSIHCF